MIKKQLLLLLIIPFLFSCYHENKVVVEKPDPLFTKEKLTAILTDIQIAEGINSHNRTIKERTNKAYKDSVYQLIFDHYGITSFLLKENINYYNADPAVMEEIYDDVLANLSKIQSEILMDTVGIVKEEMVQDSLVE